MKRMIDVKRTWGSYGQASGGCNNLCPRCILKLDHFHLIILVRKYAKSAAFIVLIRTSWISSATASATSCEIDTEYDGSSLHYQKTYQNDLKSCQSHCKSNYPAASHFTYHTSNSTWAPGRLTCWCKTSNAPSVFRSGVVSGTINCDVQGSSGLLSPPLENFLQDAMTTEYLTKYTWVSATRQIWKWKYVPTYNSLNSSAIIVQEVKQWIPIIQQRHPFNTSAIGTRLGAPLLKRPLRRACRLLACGLLITQP